MNGVTTHYYLASEPPVDDPAIALDGEGRGPVANALVLTSAAPSYAPGRHLVQASVVSGDAGEPAVGRFLRSVRLEPGLYVCGDHRDSSSLQRALVSGRRAATAVLEEIQ